MGRLLAILAAVVSYVASSVAAQDQLPNLQPKWGSAEGDVGVSANRVENRSSGPSSVSLRPYTRPTETRARPHRIHWQPLLREEFLDVSVSHVDRIADEPYTRAQLQGHVFQDWETIVENWEWTHWSDGDKFFTTYIGHSSQGNLAGWIYRNNDEDGGVEQDFRSADYRRILRNSFLVETAYAWQWKFGPLSEATIGHVGLTYYPSRHSNRSGMDDLVMDECGGSTMMVAEDWLDKHIMRPYESRNHSRASVDILRMALGMNATYSNLLTFHRPWYRAGRDKRLAPGEMAMGATNH